ILHPSSLSISRINPNPAFVLQLAALGRHLPRDRFLACADVAQRREDLRFFAAVVGLADLADLQHHLQLDEPFLPRLIVHQLLVRHGLDLLHDPAKPGHRTGDREQEEIVEKEGHVWVAGLPGYPGAASATWQLGNYLSARSSFK